METAAVCSQEREAVGESECSDAIFQLCARMHAICLNVFIKRGRGEKACGLEMLCQCLSAGLSVWCVVAVCDRIYAWQLASALSRDDGNLH